MKVIIELEIEPGNELDALDEAQALRVVNEILDAGYLQDEINEHNVADAPRLFVASAVVRLG